MKKILVVFILTITVKASSGQVLIALLFGDKLNTDKLGFGLTLGPSFTNITNVDAKSKTALNLGLFFNVKLSDRWYLHPEATPKLVFGAKDIAPYTTDNATLDSIYAGGSVKRTIKAIGLPLLVRYRIAGLFFAEAGPQIDLLMKSKDIFETEVDGNNLSYAKKTKGNYTRFDAGYALGLAYKLKPGVKGMTISCRYYGGLTDIMKTMDGSQKNSAWFINISIPVGAGKNAAKTSGDN